MDYIGIALIIAVVVGAVHFVHRYAYKVGMEAGIGKGRLQILQENLVREECKENDGVMIEMEKYLESHEVQIEKKRA